METHPDRDAPRSRLLHDLIYGKSPEMESLEKRATELRAKGIRNAITAGEEDGEPLLLNEEKFGVHVVRRKDDPDCLRISIGEVLDDQHIRYLVFRGDPKACQALLQRAVWALDSVIRTGGWEEKGDG